MIGSASNSKLSLLWINGIAARTYLASSPSSGIIPSGGIGSVMGYVYGLDVFLMGQASEQWYIARIHYDGTNEIFYKFVRILS